MVAFQGIDMQVIMSITLNCENIKVCNHVRAHYSFGDDKPSKIQLKSQL